MSKYIPKNVEKQVLDNNGKLTQDEVAQLVNLSLPTIRAICKRNNVSWIWQRRDQTGENNTSFKNGLGRSTIERLTRRVVLASGRCLHTCERCSNYKETQEQARHHKDSDRSNNESDNIEVLCQSCHIQEHNSEKTRNENGRFID